MDCYGDGRWINTESAELSRLNILLDGCAGMVRMMELLIEYINEYLVDHQEEFQAWLKAQDAGEGTTKCQSL